MKVSLKWLRELVDVKLPVDELAHALTMGGLEVEEITPVAAAFDKVVVAHVKSVVPHPNADKLRVTEVDAGTGAPLTIVCGAPNVAVGQKVPCALIGAKLGDLQIKQAKLRGVDSSGMLCSARELGLSQDHEGLLILDADAPVGQDIRAHLELDDVYLTLKLTPNRGDCLSMLGIARDVAAITGAKLMPPKVEAVATSITDTRAVRLSEPVACARYTGRVIRGINPNAKTPAWMVRRLERAGLRAIRPLVDITNYVMLERGQPMHAFDDAKLKGAIDVRFVKPGEKLQLLNEQWVEHRPQLLAIADESGAVALGGVMGGHATMVGEGTTDVFFEAAYFDAEAVQGRSRDLQLTSDAAYRYERGVDFNAQRPAQERAAQLILQICGGKAGPITETVGTLPKREAVRVRPARARVLLGYDIPDAKMAESLVRLACEVQGAEPLKVTAPSWRFDLAIEEDFIEEIARIHGFEHIPAVAPRSTLPMLPVREGSRNRFDLRRAAAAHGYQEVINYSFVAEEWERDFAGNDKPVRLANPIASTMGVMRSTLLGGLVASLASNLNRGEAHVRLFEIGRCFEGQAADLAVQPERMAGLAYGARMPEQWGDKGERVDFFDAKGDLQSIAGTLALEFTAGTHPACHPGRCAVVRLAGREIGIVGELHPRLQQRYDLPFAPVVFEILTGPLLEGCPTRFSGVSRMPAVRRDLSFTVGNQVPSGAILEAVRKAVPPLVREVEIFDLYEGKGVDAGRKSLAFRIVMQDTDRTLTDSEVEAMVTSIRNQIIEQFKAQPRT
ncbi:phenylalanine--tRNA ligase subunit beta [Usitatibacter palustris]|uniref:Phenylalanine--tRNA ligase beta subunit n=1 Tax=Usitatibacter palustris TaxID=2732487 RepID=A0A6M4HAI8_9PROT|nr:phenylalanine--tRNA ligase subunit beta [Usitatibacter palustris]QJR15424.1 Phenylalanine--tRNA ligase beta subunit [Usitatibacter palustris]